MGAGGSAGREGDRARKAGQRLERKARHAGFVADSYERGAEGERRTGEALVALEGRGWRVLHDRRAPDGGNVDHLVIGPLGIAVIDTKHWSQAVTITPDRRLVYSKYDKTAELDRLAGLVDHVRSLVAAEGVKVAVRGYLVLTGEADETRESTDLGDLRVLGVERLVPRLSSARIDLADDLIDAVTATIDAALPSMDLPVPPRPTVDPSAASTGTSTSSTGPSALFEKAHRFYYFVPWKRGGHHRLYLNDRQGTTLGWTDINTGATTIECGPDDRKFVEPLLAAADPTGLKVAPGDVPKEPTRLFGGRLLSRFARLHTSLLIGQEWRSFGKHRLYGLLIDPAVTTFDLGWIDLTNGELHPSMDGPLHKDRREPAHYLGYLLHHHPRSR